MLYRVVLCDDDPIICSGLERLVHWKENGFEVVATFDNGINVLDYMEHNPVDLLVTDIQIPGVTGLQLAEYIFEQNLNTKVVLISGYKNFEYAQQAMVYGITDYLTKPIKFSDFHSILKKFRKIISNYKEDQLNMHSQSESSELLALAQTQFLTNLIYGVYTTSDEIRFHSRKLKLDLPVSSCYAVIDFSLNYQQLVGKGWTYGSNCLQQTFQTFFDEEYKSIRYHLVRTHAGSWKIICYQANSDAVIISHEAFLASIKQYLTNKKALLSQLIDLEITFSISLSAESLVQLSQLFHRHETAIADESIEKVSKQLAELQDLIFSNVNANDQHAIQILLTQYCELLENSHFARQFYFIQELLSTILIRCRENGTSVYEHVENLHAYRTLLQCSSLLDLKHQTLNLLLSLAKILNASAERSSSIILQKAISYIQDNYQNDISLDDISRFVFLSPSYFSQFFRINMGITFSDYLTKIRMERAIDLMQNTSIKIQDVCAQVGYRNSKYFSKLFKRYVGITPTEYQTQLHNKRN